MAIDYTWLEEKILMRPLDSDERAKLGEVLHEHHCPEGERILIQGEPAGALNILRSGSAHISSECNGQNMQIATATAGELFGEITFLTGQPASATVVAAEDCVVYQLKRADCSELMGTKPELVYAFMAYMVVHAGRIIRAKNEQHAHMLQYIASSHK